jgi:hypothetical protein
MLAKAIFYRPLGTSCSRSLAALSAAHQACRDTAFRILNEILVS